MYFGASKATPIGLGGLAILFFSMCLAGGLTGATTKKNGLKDRTSHNKNKITDLRGHIQHESFQEAIKQKNVTEIDLSFNGGLQQLTMVIKGANDVYLKREPDEKQLQIFTILGPVLPRYVAAKQLALLDLTIDEHSLEQLLKLVDDQASENN